MYGAWRCACSLCAYTIVLAANEVSEVGAMTMGVAANEVGRGDDGWGQLLTTYVARVLTDVLAANEFSKVGEMMMGVAAHHSRG